MSTKCRHVFHPLHLDSSKTIHQKDFINLNLFFRKYDFRKLDHVNYSRSLKAVASSDPSLKCKPLNCRLSQSFSIDDSSAIRYLGIGNLKQKTSSTKLNCAVERQTEIWEAPSSANDYPYLQAAQGITALFLIERFLSAFVTQLRLPLPAPVLMLGAISAFMTTNSASSIELYNWIKPAVQVFDVWMPLFFAPSIAGIVLAPLPVGAELLKGIFILGGIYLCTLYMSAWVGSFAQKYFTPEKENALPDVESVSDEEKLERISSAAKFWTKKVVSSGAKILASAALNSNQEDMRKAAFTAAAALDKVSEKIQTKTLVLPSPPPNSPQILAQFGIGLLLPLIFYPMARMDAVFMAPGLLLLTISLFLLSKKLPAPFKPWITPTVASGSFMAAVTAIYGFMYLGSWRQGVQLYNAGAGKLLVMLIAPAVAALGFKVRTQRAILQKSMKQLLIICVVMAPNCLIIGALLGRLVGAHPSLTLSLVPATTTLGLAREMMPMLGSIPGLVVAGVTIAGTLGMVSAQKTLDSINIKGPVTRGAAVGSASHTLGASGLIAGEPQAAAVAGLVLALKGALSVIFLTIPPFRDLIISIAGKI